MTAQIKTITDPALFGEMINEYYMGGNVFLKTKSGNIYLQFLGYSDGRVAFRIPRVQNLPERITLFSRTRGATINAKMKFLERNEDTFIFLPEQFQILSLTRREDRKTVGGEGQSKNVIYIEKIISDFIVKNELSMNSKKIDNIKEMIKFDLSKQFENVMISFVHEGKGDVRMKYFAKNPTPFFISDINSEPGEKTKKMHNFYLNNIYSKDYKLSGKKELISEISCPVLIRNTIPYGYVQVNNSTAMSDGHLSKIKRMSVVINELFRKDNFFQPASERLLVSDMSKKGLGIVFRDRRTTRYFKQDSIVSFEVMLPTMKKAMVGAIVRNISFMENSIIKVGVEITNIDAISEVNYDEFLEMLEEKQQ